MHKKMDIDAHIDELLTKLQPITLEEMKDIRLMNRTDTKFVTSKDKLVRLLELAQGKYYAQFTNGSRIANYMTTYWDTDDYRFYMEHHNGRAPRQKVRVRTYMDSDTTFLEIKTKNNHGRTKKKRVEVPDQQITGEGGNEEFIKERVHLSLADIHPTVRNRFHRITLVNYGKTRTLPQHGDRAGCQRRAAGHHRAQARRQRLQPGARHASTVAHQAQRIQQVLHRLRHDKQRAQAKPLQAEAGETTENSKFMTS